MKIEKLFTAITVHPETGEESRKPFARMDNMRELSIAHTVDELKELKQELGEDFRLVVRVGKYGEFVGVSQKKAEEDLTL